MHIESCGMAIVPPGWIHHRRTMDTTVVILGEQGTLYMDLDGRELQAGPGDLCILPAGLPHRGERACTEATRYFWLHLQTPQAVQILDDRQARDIREHPEVARSRLQDALLLPLCRRLPGAGVIRQAFQSLLVRYREGSPCTRAFPWQAKLLLLQIQEAFLLPGGPGMSRLPAEAGDSGASGEHCAPGMHAAGPDGTSPGPGSLTGSIFRTVYENLADPGFSVKDLAHRMGYHPDYLNRHFRQVMHQSLMQWIIDRRMELAGRWIRDTDWPLGEVARRSGFASYRNFVRQFTAREGRTPSEVRRRHRLLHITH